MKKQIAILGSTGSIGTQALEVVDANPELFEVFAICANNSADLLIQQAIRYQPEFVIIANDQHYLKVAQALENQSIKVFSGMQSICDVVEMPSVDIVLTAMVGYAGLLPTVYAVKAGKKIALANKETLVVAGELIGALVQQYNASIVPVDSEHSAIFQCLAGEASSSVEKIILTASGGPFRNKSIDELAKVNLADALKHPNWEMGAKITIDSASMMNKGFEVIEAKWLFGLADSQIDVVVHPESIIHSMVQYHDGSVKAQMGLPDMKLPIQYAFAYPNRLKNSFPRLNLAEIAQLSFELPDPKRFRNLAFAYEAMRQGGNMPCILNAANEVVVDAFLREKISFLGMSEVIEWAMAKLTYIAHPQLDDYIATDALVRQTIRDHYSF